MNFKTTVIQDITNPVPVATTQKPSCGQFGMGLAINWMSSEPLKEAVHEHFHMCKPDYRKAMSYYDTAQGRYVQPDWIDVPNAGLTYVPSTNIAPTEVLPVVVSREHNNSRSTELSKRVIKPMIWGMIPPWHKGDHKSHGLSTNNCRLESALESRLYGKPLRSGQRCVVAVQGFYEWQTTKGKGQPRQPYFVKAPQDPKRGAVEEDSSWEQAAWDEQRGWSGPLLLRMAALFDSWTSPQGDEVLSFSIITMESDETFAWLHHRVPAILDSEELVDNWLEHGRVGGSAALRLLRPVTSLSWHTVSTLVNNSRNKNLSCNKPVDLKKPAFASKVMESWLKRGVSEQDSQTTKKPKQT